MPGSVWAFNFEDVAAQAKTLAASPYKRPKSELPKSLQDLTYDQYRDIRFNPDKAYWRDAKLPFELAFFHPGRIFDTPVRINEVAGKAVRPITNVSRKSKAVWNMLNQVGKKANVVAWWPSHPAEPIDGVMVSNWYQQARQIKNAEIDAAIGRPRPDVHGWTEEQWPLPPGSTTSGS